MLPRPRLQEELAYHPPVLKKVVSPAEKILQTVIVAVVGTGLGIGVGVFLAGRTLPADASAAVSATPVGGARTATTAATSQPKTTVEAKTQPALVTQTSNSRVVPIAVSITTGQVQPPRLVRASLTGLRAGFHHRLCTYRPPEGQDADFGRGSKARGAGWALQVHDRRGSDCSGVRRSIRGGFYRRCGDVCGGDDPRRSHACPCRGDSVERPL